MYTSMDSWWKDPRRFLDESPLRVNPECNGSRTRRVECKCNIPIQHCSVIDLIFDLSVCNEIKDFWTGQDRNRRIMHVP